MYTLFTGSLLTFLPFFDIFWSCYGHSFTYQNHFSAFELEQSTVVRRARRNRTSWHAQNFILFWCSKWPMFNLHKPIHCQTFMMKTIVHYCCRKPKEEGKITGWDVHGHLLKWRHSKIMIMGVMMTWITKQLHIFCVPKIWKPCITLPNGELSCRWQIYFLVLYAPALNNLQSYVHITWEDCKYNTTGIYLFMKYLNVYLNYKKQGRARLRYPLQYSECTTVSALTHHSINFLF